MEAEAMGRWRASASMGRMFRLANFCAPRVSIWWEKSMARMGEGSVAEKAKAGPSTALLTMELSVASLRMTLLWEVMEETDPTIGAVGPRRSWGTLWDAFGRCL